MVIAPDQLEDLATAYGTSTERWSRFDQVTLDLASTIALDHWRTGQQHPREG